MAKVNTKPIFEIVNEAAEAASLIEKVETLRKYNSQPLRRLLRFAIDPTIQVRSFGDFPTYKPNMLDGCETLLYNRARMMYLFKDDGKRVDERIVKRCLIQILEEIDHKDAELLCLVLSKKLPKGLTKPIVTQAFPGILDEQELS